MADEQNPFLTEEEVAPKAVPVLSSMDRVILQNFFDTQPHKRKAYLKQIGFEMSPDDDNLIRPLGSGDEFDVEIDPGIGTTFGKQGLAAAVKEMSADVNDVLFDAVQGVMVGGGAAGGGGVGAGGGPIGILLGGILGGAVGNAAAEGVKNSVADLMLDENIPQDMKLTAAQSLITGIIPKAIQGGTFVGGKLLKETLEATKAAISRAARFSGKNLTPEILDKASKNPELFTDEAVKGADQRLTQLYKELFGIDPEKPLTVRSTRQINPTSEFGKFVKPLNDAADVELNKLAKDPAANWTVGEFTQPLEIKIAELSAKSGRSVEEKAALSYLREKRNEILNFAKEKGIGDKKNPSLLQINFKEGREFLKAIQDDAFDKELPGTSVLKQMAGGGGGFRDIADQKATQVGSNLAEINAQRSKALGLFEEARERLKPSALTSTFIGDSNVQKELTKETFGKIDGLLGSDLANQVETGQMQRVVNQIYRGGKDFGSGNILSRFFAGAGAGATAGAGGGFLVGQPGLGALAGGLAGGTGAAVLGDPQTAIKSMGKLTGVQGAIEDFVQNRLSRSIAPEQAAGAALLDQLVIPKPEEEPNPFLIED